MRSLYRSIERAAGADVPVLVLGDTGTGKELVARAIHAHSPWASRPFIALNCASIPQPLLQAELFGYEKGAFTHAFERKMGFFESADGGTLLLDEIGDMPLDSQAALLRFLQDKKVTPLGGTRSVSVDVRVIAISNKDLKKCVAEGTFRADLYFRLDVLKITAPNLSERSGDVEALAHHFLVEEARKFARPTLEFSRDALKSLEQYDWPGNVRELRSCIFRAVQRSSGRYVTSKDLELSGSRSSGPTVPLQDVLHETEKRTVESALDGDRWNVSRTARNLGVSRMTLYRLMDKHGISREEKLPSR
jgi:DNA-binding NtrC family response regulator